MPSFERIRDRLPSLYQPEDNDRSLLSGWLRSVAAVLDRMQLESTQVMQAHWLRYADLATYDPWFLRSRALSRPPKPFPRPDDPDLRAFPYVDDLARLGALIPVAPWEQPPQLRDLVEDYRARIGRLVDVFRNGIGTIGALRSMVEAQLPANTSAPPERRDRPFWIEEFAPSQQVVYPAPARGEPLQLVGPLMRWTIDNDALAPAAPSVFVQGLAAGPGIDATVNPMIELYQAGAAKPRVGLAYADTVAPGQTLRLRPLGRSWLGMAGGLVSASHADDPSAPGPWQPVAGGPAAAVTAIYQTLDLALWVAAGSSLLRFDGSAFTPVLDGLAPVHALAGDGQDLLIATAAGLLRLPLFAGGNPTATADPAFQGSDVLAILRATDGTLWFGTGTGVNGGALQDTAVNALAQDANGVFYFGTALGLFQWQPGSDTWNWYEGKGAGEQNPDWQPFFPEKQDAERNFPGAEAPFLPPVNCILCARDGSVWVGTANGIARYTALAGENLGMETVLEAFPDIAAGAVFTIREDPRGLLWFGTDRGLFRHDGRDWWQFQGVDWVQLGRADTIYPAGIARGQWRFDRASSKWQRLDGSWIAFNDEPHSTAEPAVQAIAWTDGVAADLGEWDGSTFSNASPAPEGKLVVRVKPDEQTIVNGGIPALPRVPQGISTWRYLSMEAADTVSPGPHPWWSTEGRLFPPPPDLDAPGEGRYDITEPPPESDFDRAVFAYNPAARVWFVWEPRTALSVLVRLKKIAPDETVDPAIIDRVWQGIQQVRPAGVRVRLALEENIVKS